MRIIKVIVCLLLVQLTMAQNQQRIFEKFTEKEGRYFIEVNDGVYKIQFFTPEIVETTFVPKGEKFNLESHAVVLSPEEVPTKIYNTQKADTIASQGIWVVVQKKPFQIKYYYNKQEIISEKKGYYKAAHKPMDLVKDNIKADETERIEFNIKPDEVLYGGGARALGMNRRGYRLPLYNRAHYGYGTHSELMNYTMPLVLSSKRYAVHFDNAPIGYLDLDSEKNNTLTYETISGRKTYQIIVGETWLDLVDNYTNLTGKQPMLPRWALGNFSSRFGYHSQKETEATIAKFKEEKIPVDAVILDLYWFGKDLKGTMGNLEVLKDSFPDMPGMIRNLKKKGVKTILITEPFILSTSKKWDEAVQKEVLAKDSLGNPYRYDFYFGNTGLIDIYSPQGKKWFWDIYKGIINMGVAGLWGDLGEPEVHPSDLLHATGTADEVHNIYGHDWAKLIYEGYKKDFPHQRPFILMRAGSTGSQRYGMVPWSGDVSRSWDGLSHQPEISLQMGMQGVAMMHSDLGGFAGDLLDDELYERWLQYGVFQPIFRPHAQEAVPSEPVFRSDKAKKLAQQAIELRYALLPYNYNLLFENHTQGKPLMRPLFFEDNQDQDLSTYDKAYLWGQDFLISPVMEKGKITQNIIFPKGNDWFDFYTHEKIKGGQSQMVNLAANHIPTYVRGGAFIPMARPMPSTEEYNAHTLDIHYYYDAYLSTTERTYYNDDGTTPQAYEKGAYEMLSLKAQKGKKELRIKLAWRTGENYTGDNDKNYTFVIHGLERIPKRIKIGGRKTKYTWDKKNKILSFNLNWKKEKEIKIKL